LDSTSDVRIVHIVEGADIGWRTNWQFGKYRDPDNNTYKVWMDEKMYVPRFEGQPAYILPTIRNFVNGPTGMVYNPGTALGEKYKNHFFVAEFVGNPTQSGIHAFRLKPKGASFEFADSKSVMKGLLATGMDFGPDGALYFGDWINGWGTKDNGRIWKLDVESPEEMQRADTRKWLNIDLSKSTIEELKKLLSHPDMRVRQKAQFALTEKGNEGLNAFTQTLAGNGFQLARIHAIWGISQFARKKEKHASLLLPYLKDGDPEICAQAARWLGDVRYNAAGKDLIPLLKDPHARTRFFAAEALGRIAYAPGLEPIIQMLSENNDLDNYLRHAGSLALARIGNAAPLIALHKNPSRAVRIAAVLALRRMKDPGIAVFLNDTDEFIATETSRAINDDLSIPGALPALAKALAEKSITNEAFVRRAINANLRVGTNECLMRLINYSTNNTAPVAMRTEAIATIGTWAKPSVLDRVDGRYRGEIVRDLAPIQRAAGTVMVQLLQSNDAALRAEAAIACGKLQITNAKDPLLALLKKDTDAGVRVEALKTLCKLEGSHREEAIRLAMNDNEKSVRLSGLGLIGNLSISKDKMVGLLAGILETGTIEEKQLALGNLSHIPFSYTGKLLESLITQVQSGKLPPEVRLELAEAIDSTKDKSLINKWKMVLPVNGNDSMLSLYNAALYGGDPQKGAGIFWGHPTAQCMRCHAYNDQGGSAGPRLNGIGSRLSREEILQSLVAPSARIAPGYGTVTLTMKDNTQISATLLEENSNGYRIQKGEKGDTLLRKENVLQKNMGPSSMPQMQYILTLKEIRDLVSFLATQKEDN